LDEGRGTLIYCSRFASVIEALDDVCYGTRNLHVDGTNVSLPFANEGTIEHEAWKTAHGGLIDPQRPADYAVLELEVSPEGPQLWEMMDRATSYIGGHHILYSIPPAVQAFFAARASRAVAAVDLPVAIRVGGYSVDEFRHFFRSLYERAAIHQVFCCRAAVHQAGRQAVGSLPLHVTRDQLHADLVSTGVLREDAFEHILADVTYEVGHSWTSIFYQPLFPVGPGAYLIAPTLITTSLWENNLVNGWAKRHQAQYSTQVSEVKKRGAETLAEAFRGHGFIATANRTYRCDTCQLGDVDLATFDPQSDVLLLAELKWQSPAAGSHEARSRDLKLLEGMDQVRKAASFVLDHPARAADQLFGTHQVRLSSATDLRCAVIGRGHLGSFGVDKHGVGVWDFHRVQDYLRDEAAGKDLSTVVDDLQARMVRWTAPMDRQVVDRSVTLGGYHVRILAFKFVPRMPEPLGAPPPSR